jgi:hypothetical protein
VSERGCQAGPQRTCTHASHRTHNLLTLFAMMLSIEMVGVVMPAANTPPNTPASETMPIVSTMALVALAPALVDRMVAGTLCVSNRGERAGAAGCVPGEHKCVQHAHANNPATHNSRLNFRECPLNSVS